VGTRPGAPGLDRRATTLASAALLLPLLGPATAAADPSCGGGGGTAEVHEAFMESEYWAYVPDTEGPFPLLLALHGDEGDPRHNLAYVWPDIWESRRDFILVMPRCPWGSWWRSADDSGPWMDALLDHLLSRWDVDQNRVYAWGFSGGGCFLGGWAGERQGTLAAVSHNCGGCAVGGSAPPEPGCRIPARLITGSSDHQRSNVLRLAETYESEGHEVDLHDVEGLTHRVHEIMLGPTLDWLGSHTLCDRGASSACGAPPDRGEPDGGTALPDPWGTDGGATSRTDGGGGTSERGDGGVIRIPGARSPEDGPPGGCSTAGTDRAAPSAALFLAAVTLLLLALRGRSPGLAIAAGVVAALAAACDPGTVSTGRSDAGDPVERDGDAGGPGLPPPLTTDGSAGGEADGATGPRPDAGGGGGGCEACGAHAHCDPATGCVCDEGRVVVGGECLPSDPGDPASRSEAEVCERWSAARRVTSSAWWEPGGGGCDPGAMPAAAVADVMSRVNLYRWLVGLPPLHHRGALDGSAMECALIQFENGITHGPPPGAACYTEAGAQAARQSNTGLGQDPASMVDNWIRDIPFSSPSSMGHRRWILNDADLFTRVGVGYAGDPARGGSCLRHDGIDIAYMRPTHLRDFVAYPNPGPTPAVTADGVWTISSKRMRLDASSLTVERGGSSLPVETFSLRRTTGPTGGVSFRPEGWTPRAGETYDVSVGSVHYTVRLVDCGGVR